MHVHRSGRVTPMNMACTACAADAADATGTSAQTTRRPPSSNAPSPWAGSGRTSGVNDAGPTRLMRATRSLRSTASIRTPSSSRDPGRTTVWGAPSSRARTTRFSRPRRARRTATGWTTSDPISASSSSWRASTAGRNRAPGTRCGSASSTPPTSLNSSQRAARNATARATADRSVPPRPRVVSSPWVPMPWKPATTGTRPSASASRSGRDRTRRTSAPRCAAAVRMPASAPENERAGVPRAWRPSANRAAESASPVARARSVSRARLEPGSCDGPRSHAPSSGSSTRAAPRIVSVTPSKALTTTTGRSPAARCRSTTATAAAISSGRRSTDPPNLSTTTSEGEPDTASSAGRGWTGKRATRRDDLRDLVQRTDAAHVGRHRLIRWRDVHPLVPVEPQRVHAGRPGTMNVGAVRITHHQRLGGLDAHLVQRQLEEGRIRLRDTDRTGRKDEVEIPVQLELGQNCPQVRAPIAHDADADVVHLAHRRQHWLDVRVGLPGVGRELAGEDAVKHLVARLDAELAQHDAVVLPPVVLDAAVVAPGVVARPVVLVPEPTVGLLPCGAHLVLGDGVAIGIEHARERVGQRATRREQREARVQAQQSVAHDAATVAHHHGPMRPPPPLLPSGRAQVFK